LNTTKVKCWFSIRFPTNISHIYF